MTKHEKTIASMPKSAQDYISELHTLVNKKFPIVISVLPDGKIIKVVYADEWNEGSIQTGFRQKSLTAAEKSKIENWCNLKLGV